MPRLGSPSSELPWARGVRGIDLGVHALVSTYTTFRDELLFTLVEPAARAEMTRQAYAVAPSKYVEGAPIFEQGLYDWERAALGEMRLERGARLLVGGVGGGREIPGLAAAGHHVVAFDPVPALCAAARLVAARYPNVVVHEGSYTDYVLGVRSGEGPLAGVRGPYDGIVLGWGSFNHVTTRTEQVAVLAALREASPSASVLVSIFTRASANDIGGNDRLRRPLRAVLGLVTGRQVEAGLRYETRCAFIYRFTQEEFTGVAAEAGYRTQRVERCAYQHGARTPAYAILEPS
jgi:hypothetical protein